MTDHVAARRAAPRPPVVLERAAAPALLGGLFGSTVAGAGYCALVLVLGAQSARTVFPWPLDPLTAATLGGCYASGVALCWTAATARTWGGVRAAAPPALLVTVLVAVASVLERDSLWLTSGPVVGTVASWLWFPVHGALLAAAAAGLLAQRRRPGPAPLGRHRLPRAVSVPLLVAAAALALCGAALFLEPSRVGWWPWPIGRLDARVLGAWCLAYAAAVAGAVREADLVRSLPTSVAATVAGVAGLLAVLRFPQALDGGPASVVLVAAFVVLGCGGALLLVLTGRPGTLRR